jgi:hypothetical protein
MNARLRLKRWLPQALFVGAALLSAWLAPDLFPGWLPSRPAEAALPGGLAGRTLLQAGEPLDLRLAGALDAQAVEWRLDGRRVGTAPALTLARVAAGDHALSLTYRDALGQLYAVSTVVRVLPPEQYGAVVTAIQAAISLPLWEEDDAVFLPVVER